LSKIKGFQLKENYHELYQVLNELTYLKRDDRIVKLREIKKIFGTLFKCPYCASSLREFQCEDEHICSIFERCPICGKRANQEC